MPQRFLVKEVSSSVAQPSTVKLRWVPLWVHPLHDLGCAAGCSTTSCRALGLLSHCPGSWCSFLFLFGVQSRCWSCLAAQDPLPPALLTWRNEPAHPLP